MESQICASQGRFEHTFSMDYSNKPIIYTFLLYRIVLNGILFFYSIRAWHQVFSLLLDGLHYGTFSTLPNTGNIEITNISGKSIENL